MYSAFKIIGLILLITSFIDISAQLNLTNHILPSNSNIVLNPGSNSQLLVSADLRWRLSTCDCGNSSYSLYYLCVTDGTFITEYYRDKFSIQPEFVHDVICPKLSNFLSPANGISSSTLTQIIAPGVINGIDGFYSISELKVESPIGSNSIFTNRVISQVTISLDGHLQFFDVFNNTFLNYIEYINGVGQGMTNGEIVGSRILPLDPINYFATGDLVFGISGTYFPAISYNPTVASINVQTITTITNPTPIDSIQNSSPTNVGYSKTVTLTGMNSIQQTVTSTTSSTSGFMTGFSVTSTVEVKAEIDIGINIGETRTISGSFNFMTSYSETNQNTNQNQLTMSNTFTNQTTLSVTIPPGYEFKLQSSTTTISDVFTFTSPITFCYVNLFYCNTISNPFTAVVTQSQTNQQITVLMTCISNICNQCTTM
jgi:hypothetical protein